MRCVTMTMTGVALIAAACSTAPRIAIKPVERGGIGAGGDAYVEAKKQLEAGNPALAIEGFRRALRDSPRTVDVLNGLAVAYDRLGRFDLSRRFYELALAADPTNEKVLHNLAVSMRMSATAEPVAVAAAASPPIATPGEIMIVTHDAAGPRWVVPLDAPRAEAPPQPQKLLVLNAVGRRGQAGRMRHYLAGVGWVDASVGDARQRLQRSVILYPRGSRAAAERLAASLPFAPRTIEGRRVGRIVLLLGRNAARFDDGLRTRS